MTLNRFWWGLGLGLVALAVILCLLPGNEIPSVFEYNDKFSHLAGHGSMALYFTGLMARRNWWKIFLALLLLGAGIELAQFHMHVGREGDWRDVVANSLGALLGLFVGFLGVSRWPEWFARLLGRRVAS